MYRPNGSQSTNEGRRRNDGQRQRRQRQAPTPMSRPNVRMLTGLLYHIDDGQVCTAGGFRLLVSMTFEMMASACSQLAWPRGGGDGAAAQTAWPPVETPPPHGDLPAAAGQRLGLLPSLPWATEWCRERGAAQCRQLAPPPAGGGAPLPRGGGPTQLVLRVLVGLCCACFGRRACRFGGGVQIAKVLSSTLSAQPQFAQNRAPRGMHMHVLSMARCPPRLLRPSALSLCDLANPRAADF